MKNIFTLIFLSVLAIFTAPPAAAQWKQTNGPYADNITAFYLSSTLTLAGSYRNGIYRSTDEGNHWAVSDYNYGASVTSFCAFGGALYAGTDGEDIHRSTDAGRTWTRLTTGWFFNEYVTSLAVIHEKLFIGTRDNG